MMGTKHTATPWYIDGDGNIRDAKNEIVAYDEGTLGRCPTEDGVANAARIVACVNACEGINPEAVPMLFGACREFVRKCDAGEARSHRSYKQMQEAIAKASR